MDTISDAMPVNGVYESAWSQPVEQIGETVQLLAGGINCSAEILASMGHRSVIDKCLSNINCQHTFKLLSDAVVRRGISPDFKLSKFLFLHLLKLPPTPELRSFSLMRGSLVQVTIESTLDQIWICLFFSGDANQPTKIQHEAFSSFFLS